MTLGHAASEVARRTTVVVLNRDGRRHLGPCLEAALALDGLAGPEAVLVADNGSTDGSQSYVAARFHGVRVVELGANLGFAAGNDRAVAATESEFVLFLNNDTRIDRAALVHLAAAVAGGAACAGARLVDWDGRRLDFDGGAASFTGHGHSLGHGRPVPRAAAPPRPTLFASGGAMLVRRTAFLEVGGFDPDYFMYYEDVDLGWRLRLAGHEVVHVPAAVVRHRQHGTSGAITAAEIARRYERNALATVVKVYADDALRRVLPAALALAAHRSGAGPDVVEDALPPPGAWPPVPRDDWPGWRALAPLGLDLDALLAARARVQALRRRPDAEVLAHLGRPYAPTPATVAAASAMARAVRRFDLAPLLGPLVAEPPAGPARLAARAARALADGGPSWLAEEVRAYLAWRRGGR